MQLSRRAFFSRMRHALCAEDLFAAKPEPPRETVCAHTTQCNMSQLPPEFTSDMLQLEATRLGFDVTRLSHQELENVVLNALDHSTLEHSATHDSNVNEYFTTTA